MVKPGSQNARILRVLSDGKWHTTANIHRKAGFSRLNSRISELKNDRGFEIESERVPGKRGSLSFRYRLLNPPPASFPAEPFVLPREIAPRDRLNRYRIYRMVYDELELLATAGTPEAVGVALLALGAEGEFNGSCVGILDSHGREETPGTWIIQPFDTVPA